MRNLILSFVLCLFLGFPVFSQEARKIDEFGRIQCGEFMARMDSVFQEWKKNPESNVYVIYYGTRFIKGSVWNKKTKTEDKIQLFFPHREAGLAWAKAIPLYLTTMNYYAPELRKQLKEKIILSNGGYRENIGVEIWFVPPNTEFPKSTPTIAEKDIKFRDGKPPRTPNYTGCYNGY